MDRSYQTRMLLGVISLAFSEGGTTVIFVLMVVQAGFASQKFFTAIALE